MPAGMYGEQQPEKIGHAIDRRHEAHMEAEVVDVGGWVVLWEQGGDCRRDP